MFNVLRLVVVWFVGKSNGTARLHIDGYGYECGFGYGDRKRQDFEILGNPYRIRIGYGCGYEYVT